MTEPAIPRTRRQRIFKWVKIVLLIYCLIGIAVYYIQDYVILRPMVLDKDYKYEFDHPFKEVNIAYDDKTNINIVQFTPGDTVVKGVVLYFHGNRSNIARYRWFVPNFTKHGYEVWMIDYPGFGKSTGKFSEQAVYDWSLVMYKLARNRFDPNDIIIYGKSLGTGVASQLASIRDCKSLVLETPYNSMTSLAGTYLWMYPLKQMITLRLPTNEYLKKVTAPVLLFHGTDDNVIPYSNAVKLKQVLKKGDEFITIEGGDHRNLNNYEVMQNKLDSLLNSD